MTKKNLLFFVLACLFPIGMMAQGALFSKANVITNNLIEPEANQTWWGYFDGNLKNVVGIGTGDYAKAGDTYECAIFIPGNHAMGEGQIVKAVRFYLSSAFNMTDFKVWMSKHIPATADEADIEVRNVAMSELTDGAPDGLTHTSDPVNDIAFKNPYTIDADGVYIGYSFKIKAVVSAQDALPVCISMKPEITEENANFMNICGEGWKDLTGQKFGNLALRVLLEGKAQDKGINAKAMIPDVSAAKNSEAVLPVDIVNMGKEGADNFSYVVTFDGVKGEEKVYNFDSHISGLGTLVTCKIPVKTGDAIGKKNVKVEITKVDGNVNDTKLNVAEGNVMVLSEAATRKVALEIYTGTWAQLAAKGYVGAARARAIYGDDVVITNIHWGGSDPMKIDDFNKLLPLTGPVCNINREIKEVDPYFGRQQDDIFDVGNIIEEMRAVAPIAKIKAEGLINKEGTKVTANSYTTFLCDGDVENYGVAYVLSANGLKGDGEDWEQKNLFADFKSDPEEYWEYEPFFFDWIAMDKYIKGYEFNDVPVATKGLLKGVTGSIKYPFVADETQKHSVEFDLNQIGKRIQDKEKLYLNVYIINNTDGSIVNADCQKVVDESLAAIEDIEAADSNKIVKRYSVDGTILSAPVKGINIVEYADGRIVKVIVK